MEFVCYSFPFLTIIRHIFMCSLLAFLLSFLAVNCIVFFSRYCIVFSLFFRNFLKIFYGNITFKRYATAPSTYYWNSFLSEKFILPFDIDFWKEKKNICFQNVIKSEKNNSSKNKNSIDTKFNHKRLFTKLNIL